MPIVDDEGVDMMAASVGWRVAKMRIIGSQVGMRMVERFRIGCGPDLQRREDRAQGQRRQRQKGGRKSRGRSETPGQRVGHEPAGM